MSASPGAGPEPARSNDLSAAAKLSSARGEEASQFVEFLWRSFCSLRLTVIILSALALSLLAGPLANPRGESLADLTRAFGGAEHVWHAFGGTWNPIVWAYRTFELTNVFQAWWVTLLLVLLAQNVLANLIARGRTSGLGVAVVLLSLLVILGAVLAGRFTAFEGTLEVPQGGGDSDAMIVRRPDGSKLRRKPLDNQGRALLVLCDDVRLTTTEPGRPQAFESDLRVLEQNADGTPGRLVAKETINADSPLRYGGLTLAQASTRQLDQQLRAKVKVLDKQTRITRVLVVAPGEAIELMDGLRYTVEDHESNQQGLGPAVKVVRVELPQGKTFEPSANVPAGAKTTSFWVFSKTPTADRDGREDRFAFSFDRLTYLYATGLRVTHDPSTPWLYAGCALLVLGLGLAVLRPHLQRTTHDHPPR